MEVSAMKSNVEVSWDKVKLGSLIDVLSGFAFDSKKFSDCNGTPLIRIRDIKRSYTETYYLGDFDSKYLVGNGDILIGMDGEFNVAEWKGVDALLNQRVCKVLIKKKNLIDLKYLFYFLPFQLKLIEEKASFVTVKHLSVSDIKDIEIPLPPLSTQKRIAEILDAADALRRKDQELLKKYDELAQAIFIDMFGDPVKNEKGWEVRKLGTVSNMKAGNFISASEIYTDIDDGLYPCYGGNGLRGFVKSHTHNGDYILIGRQGALCGNVKITTGKFHATEHAVVCSPKIEYNVLWLYFLLGNLNLNKYSSGAAQPGLNVSTLVNIDLIFAPIKFQNQFAEKLKSIEIQFEKIKGNLLNSNKLFNSLIQKAFKGELVS